MKQYRELVERILSHGEQRTDRTGTGALSIFGHQMRFDLSQGFPLLTLKKTNFHAIAHELKWFLLGSENIGYLQKNGVHIWDAWANEDGYVEAVYGWQWRRFNAYHDQIEALIERLRRDPYSRRHIVTAWNPTDAPALPACHTLWQMHVSNDNRLSCHLYQRSGDVFIGVPFNIASYALLTMLIARECGFGLGEFVHSFGDAHIYMNHVEQAHEMLAREDRPLPTLKIREGVGLFNFKVEDLELIGYNSHPYMKADISV